MDRLFRLLQARGIPLTIVVYPHPRQLLERDDHTRQAAMWRSFCASRCKAFVDLFPPLLAAAEADPHWYAHLFIPGDIHYNRAGHRLMFEELAKVLSPKP
jgi:lysophospholipase L1-like esterase